MLHKDGKLSSNQELPWLKYMASQSTLLAVSGEMSRLGASNTF